MDAEFLLIAPILSAALGLIVSIVYLYRRRKAEELMIHSLLQHKAVTAFMRELNKEKHTGLNISQDELVKLQKQLLIISNELDIRYRAQIVEALDQPSETGRTNYMLNLLEEVKSSSKVSQAA